MDDIKRALKKYVPLLLLITKPKDRHQKIQLSNLIINWSRDRRLNENYLSVVFKKSVPAEDVLREVLELK